MNHQQPRRSQPHPTAARPQRNPRAGGRPSPVPGVGPATRAGPPPRAAAKTTATNGGRTQTRPHPNPRQGRHGRSGRSGRRRRRACGSLKRPPHPGPAGGHARPAFPRLTVRPPTEWGDHSPDQFLWDPQTAATPRPDHRHRHRRPPGRSSPGRAPGGRAVGRRCRRQGAASAPTRPGVRPARSGRRSAGSAPGAGVTGGPQGRRREAIRAAVAALPPLTGEQIEHLSRTCPK
jgi:hypothetical protein